MNEFVNRYRYDTASCREAMGAFWRYKSRKSYVVLGIMVAFFTILSPVFETVLFLVPALIGLIGFISLYVQEVQSIRNERENIQKTFHTDAPFLKIEIRGDMIYTTVSNTKNKVPVQNIIGYKKTRNMTVMFLKGQMTLAMKDDSYEKGTKEQFTAFLDLLLAQKK